MDFKILSIETKPNSEFIADGVKLTNCIELHKQGFYGEGMRVCVIDTGYDIHDFTKDNVICGKNFTNEGVVDDYKDFNGHWTFCIGEIVQIAPKCQIVVAKALKKNGDGDFTSIINAFKYAIEQNCHVISMSLGSTNQSEELHNLVKQANELGIIVGTAAGNDGDGNANTDELCYPASYEESVNVGAVNIDKTIANYSNSSQWVDLCAVGTNITSTFLNNKWCQSTGTSMAVPIISGIALLLREKFIKEFERNPSEQEIYSQLIKNTEDLKISRRFQGNGMIKIKVEG